jgi:nucleoside-diphosphate-sugar epimerase
MSVKLFNNVFVTGGAGYCASLLIPQLLTRGYKVTAFDPFWFGDYLPQHPDVKRIKGDIRDVAQLRAVIPGHDAFVSLGCVSNDASFELDENLSTSINLDAFEPMVIAAKDAGIKRFIYASSSSVYGVSDQPEVTEDHPLVPVSLYNKYKGMCEPLLQKHADGNFTGVIFRPATVCGYAPRLRLDLSVNILTNHAVTNDKITVFGGSQLRPNLHVQDYCDAVEMFLLAPADKIQKEIFNVGFQNMAIMDIAKLVKKVVAQEYPDKSEIEIVTTTSDDIRSYHINSDKVARVLGFKPKYTIEDAVRSLCAAFKAGKIPNSLTDDRYYNIRTVKKLNLK